MARRCEGCGGRGVLHGGRWREVVGGRSGADERGGADGCCGAGRGDAWYYKADDGAVTHGTTRRTTARAARGGAADSGGDSACAVRLLLPTSDRAPRRLVAVASPDR
jgi:hypothetical protein